MKKTGIWQKWLQPTQFGDTVLVISLKVVNLNLNDRWKLWKKEPKWEEMIDRRRLTNKKKHAAVNTLASWCCLSAIPWEYIWELCWNSMRIPWRIPLRIPLRIPFRIHLGIFLKIPLRNPLRNPLWILPLVNTPQQPLSINQCILAV